MIGHIILLIIGLLLLIIGADYFVMGSSRIATRFGIPKLIIGLTIVAIGTSAPEFGVNIISSLVEGRGELVLGNILGSNISNILLIFAGAALFTSRVNISKNSLKQISFTVIVALVLLGMSLWFNLFEFMTLNKIEGIAMFVLGLAYWFYLYKTTKLEEEDPEFDHIESNKLNKISSWGVLFIIVGLSLVALLYGSKLVTDHAVAIAKSFGVSEFIIAGTIIAIGTSLPELAASIQAVRQKNFNLMIGNVVGSNIINTLFILGISVFIRSVPISSEAMPYLWLNILAPIVLFLIFKLSPGRVFQRWQASIFLILYFIFIIWTSFIR